MKKIIVLIFVFIFCMQISIAKGNKDYTLKFNGNKYHLLYSVKNKDFGGYLNEYYKKGETYNIWSELIAVHHFPNAYSPIDRIQSFKEYLNSMHVPSSLTFNDKKNTAMIDFIMIADKNMPVVLEFNIFKYEKSKKCGSIAIQYAKRYSATTTMQIEEIKKDFEKNRKQLIKKVKHFNIPEIITEDIDKCISASEIVNENKKEQVSINKEKEVSAVAENNENEEKITTEENTAIENKPEITKQIGQEETLQDSNENIEAKENKLNSEELNISEESNQANTDIVNTKEETTIISENTETLKEEKEKEEKTDEISLINKVESENLIKEHAPIPDDITTLKNTKNVKYEVTNNKDGLIAVPRTKKELKAQVKRNKQRQKELKKQSKLKAKAENKVMKEYSKNKIKQEKLEKKQAKADKKSAKKQAKEELKAKKKAEKLKKKTYEVSNSNSDLIAKKKKKKELKENNKRLKKQAKERAKEAKRKLSE